MRHDVPLDEKPPTRFHSLSLSLFPSLEINGETIYNPVVAHKCFVRANKTRTNVVLQPLLVNQARESRVPVLPWAGVMDPRLLQSLRLALSTLYSLPIPPGSSYEGTPKEANDFLVELQSRNVRRRILSLQKSRLDHINNSRRKNNASVEGRGRVEMGSSWLAFLAVLCQMKDGVFVASPPERLFAAQSVLHRARRGKTVEAIDIEVESGDIEEEVALHMYQNNDFVLPLVDSFKHLMSHWNPFIFEVISSYHVVESPNNEERVKVDLMILSLAAVSYITACQPDETPHRNATLECIGSTITTLSLRTRFSDTTDTLEDQSLVWMVSHAYTGVFSQAQKVHAEPRAAAAALTATLGAIPETILGNSGGAKGKMSIDPKHLEAAVNELRAKGFGDLWNSLQHLSSLDSDRRSIFVIMAKWAAFLCVPSHFINEIAGPLVAYISSSDPKEQKVAILFVFAVLDGATWTFEKIISFSLGLSETQNVQQSGKKKQSSKSKKRQKDIVGKKMAETAANEAGAELRARGEVACRVSTTVWSNLLVLFKQALSAAEEGAGVDGEGPIGCIAQATQACLPFLLANHASADADMLFREISAAFLLLCESSNNAVRGLAFQPLYTLHRAILGIPDGLAGGHSSLPEDLLLRSVTALARRCPYPDEYFVELVAESDDEVEVGRNDVRDLLRAVAGGEDEASAGAPMGAASFRMLSSLIEMLRDELLHAQHNNEIPVETIVHTYSALAKPLARLARDLSLRPDQLWLNCLQNSLAVLALCLSLVSRGFQENQNVLSLLPVSRTLCMGVASMAPLLGTLSQAQETQPAVLKVLPLCSKLALLSLRTLPELATSERLSYEIRGTMRGPGGEDHVASVMLMRLSSENDTLTQLMVRSVASDVKEMCDVHEFLKANESWTEDKKPRTTPKTRRILLGVICRLELSSRGQAGASELLLGILRAAATSISSVDTTQLNEQSFFILCESALDISSLEASVLSSFFQQDEKKTCWTIFQMATARGYELGHLSHSTDPSFFLQWNRLRGALFTLFLACGNPDLSEDAARCILELINSECSAGAQLFGGSVNGRSTIFNDEIVSPDNISSGIFIMAIGKHFEKRHSVPLPVCIETMCHAAPQVLGLINLRVPCGSRDICDPRCSIAEAWFSSLSLMAQNSDSCSDSSNSRVGDLLTNSVVAATSLIFAVKLSKDEIYDGANGMSMDGPQSLALMDFLTAFLGLGSARLSHALVELSRSLSVDLQGDPNAIGLAILLSALFRAVQGALPPWVLESIPSVFENLYDGIGKNHDAFGAALKAAMELRLPPGSSPVGGVAPGELLSGHIFANVCENTCVEFRREAVELAKIDNHGSWKRLKHVVKGICGGKKKSTGFAQKPSYSRFEYERI